MAPREHNYHQTRATAVKQLEKTILELSDMFTRVGNLVAEQGRTTIRIDEDLTGFNDNMEQSIVEVSRTLEGLSGGQWLAIRVLMILIFFALIFTVFFL